MMMAHHNKTEIKGRYFSRQRNQHYLEDRLKENDPELNWILNGPRTNQ
jgi:hypothetical protein